MAAKRKTDEAQPALALAGVAGAPAALARLEKEELSCYEKKQALEKALAELAEPPLNATTEAHELWATQKSRLQGDLLFAFSRWDIARKSLNDYHKSILPQEREGAKSLNSDVQEWVKHILDCVKIAHQKCRISMAQIASKSNSPEDFVVKTDATFSEQIGTAIRAAMDDSVIPKWISA